ncbi:hypothetical protein TRFO_18117 [Tritrichomonas foetus]|uniref:Uncharacterized protein n=1 Tax=Tritrichomonas foetus TaxID=1144522 RepID=A0A1J4KLM2_9EUKA|nr:hypothetical protein TRFO_18117 [Tritrichomonas foetus]|eukprot:OHT12207.1 hypothetical protein TRFO_18117 [Tritrichomonas foetus]
MSAQFFELHPLIIFPQLFSIIEQTATPMKFRFLWIFIQIIDQNEIESEIPLKLIEEAIQYLINCVKECNSAMNIIEILLSIMIYFISDNYDLFFSLTSKFRLYKSLADLLQKENSFKTIELWLILVTLIMSNLYDGFLPILLCYEVIIRLKKIKSDLNMEQANLIDVILDKADKMGSIEKSDGNAN